MKRKIFSNSTETHIAAKTNHLVPAGKHHASDHDDDDGREVAVAATGPVQGWLRFWFTPVAPTGLHVARVLAGLLFACWLLTLAGHQEAFFGLGGWLDSQAIQEGARLMGADAPPAPFSWSVLYLCGANTALVNVVYWSAIAIFFLFALGVAPRITAVLTWVLVVSFIANPAITYDADYLLVILAFYLMIGYVLYGQWSRNPSVAERILGPGDAFVFHRLLRRNDVESSRVSYAANLALRLLQVHFAIVLVTSGLHKFQNGDWWAGVGLWYPMHPPFETTFKDIKTPLAQAQSYLFLMSLATYLMVAWQVTFPLFAWRKGWICRTLLLGGAAIGWLGMIFIYQLPLFGPILCIAALCYVSPEEWSAVFARVRQMTGKVQPATGGVKKPARVGA